MRRPGTPAESKRTATASPDERMKWRATGASAREGGDGCRGQGGGVLLVVELEQRLGMDALAGDQGREILEQHDPVREGRAVAAAQAQGAERRGGRGADGTLAGRLAVEGEVVQDGEAVVGVQDEVDLDAGAGGHALEDAAAGEGRILGAAPGAVPLEEGAATVAAHRDRGGHRRSATSVDGGVVAIEREGARPEVDRLPGAPGAGVGHLRLEPQAVGELEVDDGMGAVVGDAVDLGRALRLDRRDPQRLGPDGERRGAVGDRDRQGETGMAEAAALDAAARSCSSCR